MTTGFGEPGEWNGQHFKSPTILDFGDYLLMAMEGWSDPATNSGIGLMIGIERWLKPRQTVIVLNSDTGDLVEPPRIHLGNYGAGDLTITDIDIPAAHFTLELPPLPFTLKSSGELILPIMYTPDPGGDPVAGTVTVYSDGQIGEIVKITLLGY
ncbi:MAG TPA: hypothetical protein PLV45_03910 [bacterium]|nr:hypothetical protein [bacterium]